MKSRDKGDPRANCAFLAVRVIKLHQLSEADPVKCYL